ncbi:MAG: PAS domain-containing protein [Methyloligellaceae bacterium]
MLSELAFRAQLVIREQRDLYDYWCRCAGGRSLPARGDIDPSAFSNLLPFICLIDIDMDLDNAVVRLAGTRIKDIYGFEITGKTLGEFEWGDKADYWQAVYSRVIGKRAPLQGAIKGPIVDRDHITLFWLRLPLSDDGERVNKILCLDTPVPFCPAGANEDSEIRSVSRGLTG